MTAALARKMTREIFKLLGKGVGGSFQLNVSANIFTLGATRLDPVNGYRFSIVFGIICRDAASADAMKLFFFFWNDVFVLTSKPKQNVFLTERKSVDT